MENACTWKTSKPWKWQQRLSFLGRKHFWLIKFLPICNLIPENLNSIMTMYCPLAPGNGHTHGSVAQTRDNFSVKGKNKPVLLQYQNTLPCLHYICPNIIKVSSFHIKRRKPFPSTSILKWTQIPHATNMVLSSSCPVLRGGREVKHLLLRCHRHGWLQLPTAYSQRLELSDNSHL